MRYAQKWPEYAKQWDQMQIKPQDQHVFDDEAKFAIAHKAQYQEVEKATGLPWYMVAVIHRRESDANFNTYLGNGDPLNRPTRDVPRGRGPFPSFIAGAIDAVKQEGWGNIQDWRLEKILYYCEAFNGWGYAMYHGDMPSPYLWGGTNIQKIGKYTSDGRWSSGQWDPQPGCAPLLATIAKLDPTVKFTRED